MQIAMPGKVTQTSLFVMTLALGIGSIVIGKWIVAAFLVFGILLPVVLMIAYATYNIRSNFLDSTRSQVADNCYFLGFLYFLASLAITLAQFSTGGFGPESRMEVGPIIRGFGVALVTTITGLFLRILLLQNIAGLSSAREKAEESLLNAVNTFHDHTVLAMDLLGRSRDQILDTSRQTTEQTNQALQHLTESCRHTLAMATEGYVKALSEAAQRASIELSGIVTELRQKVTALDIPADAFTRKVDPPLAQLGDSVSAMGAAVTTLAGGVADNATHTRKFASRIDKLFSALEEQSGLLERALGKLTEHSEPLGQVGAELGRAAEAATRLADELERRFGALKQTPDAARTAAEAILQLTGVVSGLREALDTVVNSLDASVGQVNAGIRRAHSGTEQLVSATEAAAAAVGGDVRRLGEAVEQIQQGIQRRG